MTTGIDLTIERIRARITQTVLSYYLGVTRPRISMAEHQPRVTDDFARRYRKALKDAKRHV